LARPLWSSDALLEAIAFVLLTYWLGCRLFGPDAGVVAGLAVATTGGIYSMAHSAMPDMAQLVAIMGAMGVYVASGFGDRRTWLVAFYGIIAVGSLAKGAAGFLPLAIVLVDTMTVYGVAGLKRLVSIPGWIVLAALAVPWWVVARRLRRTPGIRQWRGIERPVALVFRTR